MKRCDPDCILRVFPDQREGSGTALVLKTTKNKNSVRHIFMTEPLKAELRHWLEKLAREETDHPDHYENSGMLFRFSNGHPVEQTYIRKKFESWQAAHPEYNRIVFHALRHSSATYQLVVSGGDSQVGAGQHRARHGGDSGQHLRAYPRAGAFRAFR